MFQKYNNLKNILFKDRVEFIIRYNVNKEVIPTWIELIVRLLSNGKLTLKATMLKYPSVVFIPDLKWENSI